MGSLAKTVRLASLQASSIDDTGVLHGDTLWFAPNQPVKLMHEDCESVFIAPPQVWVNFLLYCHPELGAE